MVQPQGDCPLQWEMAGEEGGGALRVPPELASNEVVTRLLGDNQQLRGLNLPLSLSLSLSLSFSLSISLSLSLPSLSLLLFSSLYFFFSNLTQD